MGVPSGTVYLCKNAIVDRNYSHTIDFKNSSEQFAYWSSLIKFSLSDYSYIRRKSQFIKVDKTLDELQDVNYLFYRSSENSKLYYCFVTGKEYIADNTTYIYYETDVLQTYMFDYEVKQSYVLQEHCDRWDANLKPIYSRTDEGLDYGQEYTVEAGYKIKPDHEVRWFLAVIKPSGTLVVEGENTSEPARVGLINPYIYLLLPEYSTEPTYLTFSYKKGSEATSDAINDLDSFLKLCAEGDTEKGLGNFVQQIIKLPYSPFDFKVGVGKESPSFHNIDSKHIEGVVFRTTLLKEAEATGMKPYRYIMLKSATGFNLMRKLAEMSWDEGIKDAMPTAEQWEEIKANPYTTERDKRFESKLLTHPYRYNLLTDWKNAPMIVKNEFIGGDKIKVGFTQSISFNSPARYWLEDYKKDPEGRGTSLVQLTQEEAPVINDAYYTYMLENKNQLQADRTNATISTATGVLSGVGNGAMAGAMVGGPMGALIGGLTGAVSPLVSGATNYGNLVRSQNAKQKDLKNLPDTIINPNDCNFNYFDSNEFVCFYRYKICCEFENLLADTFAMSGYTVKRVKIPNLKTRVRYNYVKTVGANIVGSFDQEDLATIRAIFDNGITFWHYNTVNFKPLDYSFENIETKLL